MRRLKTTHGDCRGSPQGHSEAERGADVPRSAEQGDGHVGKLSTVKTVEGQSVTIFTNHRVHVDNAKITKAHMVTDNDVIPIIDRVMLPK
jgi:uncharacterized surface protein with fasciclin (FAS1) repeats